MVHIHTFVVTSIDVQDANLTKPDENIYGKNAKWVRFSVSTPNDKYDGDFAYLQDVRENNGEWLGVKVDLGSFRTALAKRGKKVLACVHGYTVKPSAWLHSCWEIGSRHVSDTSRFWDDTIVIPVIWPSSGGNALTNWYHFERKIAKQAGKAFKDISADGKGERIKFSLMCHSMGNRVLMSFAHSAEKLDKVFDNVFMVAADVWEECFNCNVHEGHVKWEFENAGWKLCQMVTGKIYVAHYQNDQALGKIGSGGNFGIGGKAGRRLGVYGTWTQKAHHRMNGTHSLKDRLEDFDMNNTDGKNAVDGADYLVKHSYQTCPHIVKNLYYEKMKD